MHSLYAEDKTVRAGVQGQRGQGANEGAKDSEGVVGGQEVVVECITSTASVSGCPKH